MNAKAPKPWVSTSDGIELHLLVQPRASRARFGPVHEDRIKVFVNTPPVDGAANQAVIALLAKTFQCKKGAIEIIQGHTSRRKTVRVRGIDEMTLQVALGLTTKD